jgi:hypothetical protein
MPVHKRVRKLHYTKLSAWNTYAYLILKIILLVALFYMLSRYKPFILVIAFEILDFAKNVLKQTIPYIPLDLVFIFGLAASYYYGFIFGVIIFFLGILNRLIMTCLEFRHVSKIVRHLTLFFVISLLSPYVNFFMAAIALLIINYILKYGLRIARGQLAEFDKTHFHVINFIGALAFLYLIYVIYAYMPFLA